MKRLFAIMQLVACLTLAAFPAAAQQRSHAVRGVVTDATGPVPGVNVVVAGSTSIGTMTGMDGAYSLPSVPVLPGPAWSGSCRSKFVYSSIRAACSSFSP